MTRHGIRVKTKRIELGTVEMTKVEGDKATYEAMLAKGQLERLRVQQAYHHQKRRAVLVFEGWDAAGKGGSIRRLTDKLDPRGFHSWALAVEPGEGRARAQATGYRAS